MSTTTELLQDFVDKAVRNYKYPKSTGANLRSSLKIVEEVLQEDESQSLDVLKQRLDDVINRVDVKYPNRYTADTLMVYKSRVLKVIKDYEQYGQDAKSMAGWATRQKKQSPSSKPSISSQSVRPKQSSVIEAEEIFRNVASNQPLLIPSSNARQGAKMENIDLPLQGDRGVTIYYPADLKVQEAEKIANILKGIASLADD